MKRVQSLKYSEADKFAIVGGTLGLFTGFSFIVIVELLFWIIVTIKKVLTKPKAADKQIELPSKIKEKVLIHQEQAPSTVKNVPQKREERLRKTKVVKVQEA